jgi:hypothetical protein
MNYIIKLYIGIGKDKEGEAIHQALIDAAITKAQTQLSVAYGGCTTTYGEGSWLNSYGVMVVEDCVILETIVAEIQHDKIKSIASEIKARLAQESVLLTIEGLLLKQFI